MRSCPYCGSHKARSRGTRTNASGVVKHRYHCNECGKNFQIDGASKFNAHRELSGDIHVFTAAQNGASVNQDFYGALVNYCDIRGAQLHVIPVRLGVGIDAEDSEWDVEPEHILRDTVDVCDKLRVLGNINLLPTLENPIAGLDYLSKGDSLIIGHPQLQMKTLAVNATESPAIITTTGVITEPNYSISKQGEKARFNHSYSAIVVEKDDGCFHLRVLNADDTGGFFDIDGYYTEYDFEPLTEIEALITGDEHAIFVSQDVLDATYKNEDSIVSALKPKVIVRHDVLDCYSVSHHHRKNFFTQYAKYETGTNSIDDELHITMSFINDTTPETSRNIIVSANHNDHLLRWLNEADPKTEPWNAKTYHALMWMMLDNVHYETDGSFSYPNPFELWATWKYPDVDVEFTGRNESYKIMGIEISNHGDVGTNGSRGSLLQYSRLANKCIIGHSHSPGINKGAYQVGTSSKLKLEYTRGPSSWMNTHAIIYPNGKRQLINIIQGGKWRKSSS